jgi:hypothetical protein
MFRALVILSLGLSAASAGQAEQQKADLEIVIEYGLTAQGGASGSLEITARGFPAELLERWITGLPAPERRFAAGYFLDRLVPGADILNSEIDEPTMEGESLRLQCSFRQNFFAPYSQGRLNIPTLGLCRFLEPAGLNYFITADLPAESAEPVEIGEPISLELSETISLPEGYQLLGSALTTELEAGPARLSAKAAFEDSKLVRTLKFELSEREIAPKDLSSFADLRDALCTWRPGAAAERVPK